MVHCVNQSTGRLVLVSSNEVSFSLMYGKCAVFGGGDDSAQKQYVLEMQHDAKQRPTKFAPKPTVPQAQGRVVLSIANNLLTDDGKPDAYVEKPLGVQRIQTFEQTVEYLNQPTNEIPSQRTRSLLCCCMNVGGQRPLRKLHVAQVSKHFDDCSDWRLPKLTQRELALASQLGVEKGQLSPHRHQPLLYLDSEFVMAPSGVGESSYREAEIILAGAFALVDETKYEMRRRFLEPLPVLRIANWSVVTPEFLEQKLRELRPETFNIRTLFMPYWYDKIIEAADVDRPPLSRQSPAAYPDVPCGFGPHYECAF